MELKQVEMELGTPIEVSVKGQSESHGTVVLTEPSSRNRMEIAKIKRIWSLAIEDVQSRNTGTEEKVQKDDSDDSKVTHKEIISLICGTGEDDDALGKVFDAIEKIFSTGCAQLGGVTINSHLFQKLSYDDLEMLTGEYILSFLYPSMRS